MVNPLLATPPPLMRSCPSRQGTSWLPRSWVALGIGIVGSVLSLSARPALSAERVSINLGILQDSFKVSSLETFAATGKVPPDLRDYIRLLDDEQRAQLRIALSAKADVSVVAVAQFLYSPQGEVLLQRLGQVIQSEARQPGFFGIRAALILAAAEPEGITLLGVLRKFPTPGIRVSVGRGWEMANELRDLVTQTQTATTQLQTQAQAEALMDQAAGLGTAELSNLGVGGPWRWEQRSLLLRDSTRDRRLPVDVYLPLSPSLGDLRAEAGGSPFPQRWPTVVISHGLNSDRTSFAYLAEHLASHGYAVIVPEHPGSSAQQVEALLQGRANEIADPEEFVNRPLDVTFILDTLGQDPQFSPQLALEQVGIVGQSFGGYTALALGGAQVNAAALRRSCQKLDESWNVSLALQCRALAASPIPDSLRDPRVAAIVAINPFMSAIFGQEGLASLAVPTLIIGGDADTVAPALLEQIEPFRWIQGNNRHLALMIGGTHFSAIAEGEGESALALPEFIIGRDLAAARGYTQQLSLATFRTYLGRDLAAEKPVSASYLSSRYKPPSGRGRLGLAILQELP